MQDNVTSAFRMRFGREPQVVVRAPGRVNLIGEHTDYNDGYVLPVALDRAAWIAAAPIEKREARVYALDMESGMTFSLENIPPSDGNWADYPRGVAWALQERGLNLAGMEAVLASNVPVGSGLSSSAAVEVAFAYTWQRLSGFRLSRRDLALTCQRAENVYVGVNCGIMDQMASALGVKGHALLLDCRTLETETVPLPQGFAIVVADTGVRRQLAASEYNVRRSQCERAVQLLSADLPGIRALRDVTLNDLERLKKRLPEVIYRRARHVISDNARVFQVKEALQKGGLETVGALMRAGHVSLRDDYEVSSPELDVLVEAAWKVEGCYGSRLTGAGFGGCTVSLVATEAVPNFQAQVAAAYEKAFGRRPEIYVCQAADGVKRV